VGETKGVIEIEDYSMESKKNRNGLIKEQREDKSKV